MTSNPISVKVSDDLKEQIEEYQEEGEKRSPAVRRLLRKGLEDGPGNAMYAVVVTFAVAWAVVAIFTDSYTLLRLESGIFHLLAILWVGVPELRERVDSFRE